MLDLCVTAALPIELDTWGTIQRVVYIRYITAANSMAFLSASIYSKYSILNSFDLFVCLFGCFVAEKIGVIF